MVQGLFFRLCKRPSFCIFISNHHSGVFDLSKEPFDQFEEWRSMLGFHKTCLFNYLSRRKRVDCTIGFEVAKMRRIWKSRCIANICMVFLLDSIVTSRYHNQVCSDIDSQGNLTIYFEPNNLVQDRRQCIENSCFWTRLLLTQSWACYNCCQGSYSHDSGIEFSSSDTPFLGRI